MLCLLSIDNREKNDYTKESMIAWHMGKNLHRCRANRNHRKRRHVI